MARRSTRKAQRVVESVLGAFIVLFTISGISSWYVWNEHYDGLFKQKIFSAVLLGNAITSAVGALMVYSARRR